MEIQILLFLSFKLGLEERKGRGELWVKNSRKAESHNARLEFATYVCVRRDAVHML
jgi:hypothetical protein